MSMALNSVWKGVSAIGHVGVRHLSPSRRVRLQATYMQVCWGAQCLTRTPDGAWLGAWSGRSPVPPSALYEYPSSHRPSLFVPIPSPLLPGLPPSPLLFSHPCSRLKDWTPTCPVPLLSTVIQEVRVLLSQENPNPPPVRHHQPSSNWHCCFLFSLKLCFWYTTSSYALFSRFIVFAFADYLQSIGRIPSLIDSSPHCQVDSLFHWHRARDGIGAEQIQQIHLLPRSHLSPPRALNPWTSSTHFQVLAAGPALAASVHRAIDRHTPPPHPYPVVAIGFHYPSRICDRPPPTISITSQAPPLLSQILLPL